jgi:hypothetical protein
MSDTIMFELIAGAEQKFTGRQKVRTGIPPFKGIPLAYEFYDEKGNKSPDLRRYSNPRWVTRTTDTHGNPIVKDKTPAKEGFKNGVWFVDKGDKVLLDWMRSHPWNENTDNNHPRKRAIFRERNPIKEEQDKQTKKLNHAKATLAVAGLSKRQAQDLCRVLGYPYQEQKRTEEELKKWLDGVADEKPELILKQMESGSEINVVKVVNEALDKDVVYYATPVRTWRWRHNKKDLCEVEEGVNYKDGLAAFLKSNPDAKEQLRTLINKKK